MSITETRAIRAKPSDFQTRGKCKTIKQKASALIQKHRNRITKPN